MQIQMRFYSNLFNVPCDFVYNLRGFILNINVTSCKASSYFLEPEIICQRKHIFQFFFIGNWANLGHTFTVSKKIIHPPLLEWSIGALYKKNIYINDGWSCTMIPWFMYCYLIKPHFQEFPLLVVWNISRKYIPGTTF